jgi:hypothetical protein
MMPSYGHEVFEVVGRGNEKHLVRVDWSDESQHSLLTPNSAVAHAIRIAPLPEFKWKSRATRFGWLTVKSYAIVHVQLDSFTTVGLNIGIADIPLSMDTPEGIMVLGEKAMEKLKLASQRSLFVPAE